MGGGHVDFKFSDGFDAKVIVEMKRSGGAIESGYFKQIEKYQKASQTDFSVYVVIDYGQANILPALRKIKNHRESSVLKGTRIPELLVIDARKKPSASKLR